MGAVLAQNFVLRYSNLVLRLVLSRPGWRDRPHPKNVAVFPEIAQLIRQHGIVQGHERFVQSKSYREIRRHSPDASNSRLNQFDHPRADETVVKLERIPNDAPRHTLLELSNIQLPTLVLANRHDLIHPFDYGQIQALAIPGAELKEVTSKSVSCERHEREVQYYMRDFLKRRFL